MFSCFYTCVIICFKLNLKFHTLLSFGEGLYTIGGVENDREGGDIILYTSQMMMHKISPSVD